MRSQAAAAAVSEALELAFALATKTWGFANSIPFFSNTSSKR